MSLKKKFLTSVVAASAAIISSNQVISDAHAAKNEKCYGVVAKGMNDCASAKHSCAGQSSENSHPEEWIYVPAGLCDRIAGGVKEPKK